MKFRIGKSKSRSPQKKQETPVFSWYTCKNCGYSFEGHFCPSCGQSIKEVQQPILHFLADMFGALFALDMRAVHSIPMLLTKPGKLSTEFVDGKRSKHVAPFRFYLFVSLVFFFLISWQTKKLINQGIDVGSTEIVSGDSADQARPIANINVDGDDTIVPVTSLADALGILDKIRGSLEAELADSSLTLGEREEIVREFNAVDDPDVMISKVYQYLSWSFFVLMPWFAMILLVFFRKKRKFYVEHLIFSVNLHTFFFLVLTIVILIELIVPDSLDTMGKWIFLFMASYAVLGIRNFYKKRWWPAIWKTLVIFLLYGMSSVALIALGIWIITLF